MNKQYIQFRKKKQVQKEEFANFGDFLKRTREDSKEDPRKRGEKTGQNYKKPCEGPSRSKKDAQRKRLKLEIEANKGKNVNGSPTEPRNAECASHLVEYEKLISKLISDLEKGEGEFREFWVWKCLVW